ncbi:unnamed protein product, partial [Polarella glacialis]
MGRPFSPLCRAEPASSRRRLCGSGSSQDDSRTRLGGGRHEHNGNTHNAYNSNHSSRRARHLIQHRSLAPAMSNLWLLLPSLVLATSLPLAAAVDSGEESLAARSPLVAALRRAESQPPLDEAVSPIGPIEVEEAQKAWADGVLQIGAKFEQSLTAAQKEAASFVDDLYGHGLQSVLFKPSQSTSKPFRTSREGVISHLAGGYGEFPEDQGFAVSSKWNRIRYENAGIEIEGLQALAMGNSFFRDTFTGNETKLEYTFGYFRAKGGKLKINLHFSSIPYTNHSNATQSLSVTEDEVRAAQKAFADSIIEIGAYHEKGWHYYERTAMFVDTMFAFDFGPVLFKAAE